MCDHPECPGYDGIPHDPYDGIPEDDKRLRVQCSAAAVEIMRMLNRGWFKGVQGVTFDVQQEWGFPGMTRLAWVYAQAMAVLPVPEGLPKVLLSTFGALQKYLHGLPEEETGLTIALTDQVDTARAELVTIVSAGPGSYQKFAQRFDEITNVPKVMTPLLLSLTIMAALHWQDARKSGMSHLIDQFVAVVTADLALTDDDEMATFRRLFKTG